MNEQNRTVKNTKTSKPWKVVCTVSTFKKANSKRRALINEWKKSDVTSAEIRVVKRAINKFSVKLRLSAVPSSEKLPQHGNAAALEASRKAKKVIKSHKDKK